MTAICIQGFSHDVFRKDHPNEFTLSEGVYVYITERTYQLKGQKFLKSLTRQ